MNYQVTDRQKAMHTSPPWNMHRWAKKINKATKKAPALAKGLCEIVLETNDYCLQIKQCNEKIAEQEDNLAKQNDIICCGQPWVWHMFSEKACDGLCGLLTFNGFGWNTTRVSIVNLGLWHVFIFHQRLHIKPWGPVCCVASLQFLPSGQYGLCFGYCFSGSLPLCSHNGEVTFLEPVSGSP